MELDPPTRQRISQRAARYLREEEAYWTQRYWLCDLDLMGEEEVRTVELPPDRDSKYTIGYSATIGRVREWLQEHNFGARNRRCGVCAQGALMLAMAEDPSIPDEVVGLELLPYFEPDASQAASVLGLGGWSDIVAYNDEQADGEDDVIRLLDRMGTV